MLPAICRKPARTKRGANRQYSAAIADYRRRYAGGGAFGWDWSTLRANDPELWQFLQDLRSQYYCLPD